MSMGDLAGFLLTGGSVHCRNGGAQYNLLPGVHRAIQLSAARTLAGLLSVHVA